MADLIAAYRGTGPVLPHGDPTARMIQALEEQLAEITARLDALEKSDPTTKRNPK